MTDRLLYRRALEGFVPFNDDASDYFAGVKLGEVCELKANKVRNAKYHKRFFVMLKLVSENSNPSISTKAAMYFAKLVTGTGETITDSKGNTHFVPGSISFAKMDQAGFEAFVQTAIPPLVGRFMAGTAPQDLIAEAMSLAA